MKQAIIRNISLGIVGLATVTSLTVWAATPESHGPGGKRHTSVRSKFHQLARDHKIAQVDLDAIKKKQKENHEFAKDASKGGLTAEEKTQIKANRQSVEKLMADAVAKVHTTAPAPAAAPVK